MVTTDRCVPAFGKSPFLVLSSLLVVCLICKRARLFSLSQAFMSWTEYLIRLFRPTGSHKVTGNVVCPFFNSLLSTIHADFVITLKAVSGYPHSAPFVVVSWNKNVIPHMVCTLAVTQALNRHRKTQLFLQTDNANSYAETTSTDSHWEFVR